MTALPRVIGRLHTVLPDGVRFDDRGDRLVLRATSDLDGIASGRLSIPTVAVGIELDDLDPATELVGFGFTQFALPLRARLDGRFEFAPAHNLRSPSMVVPLVLRSPDGRVELLAPLDAWHEQVIAVGQDAERITSLRWGWHGDLDVIPEGTTATLAVVTGTSVEEVVGRWGAELRQRHGTTRPARADSVLLDRLSYWTDNGAAYWYRTEPGLDISTTLERKLAELDALGVDIGAVELDSWFYPHEIQRSVSETGYLEEVPPTGMLEWRPRPEVLPDGIGALRERLGDRPLVLHARHISPASPYPDDPSSGEWWSDLAAHPVDPSFFRRWFDDCVEWGVTCIEQDWMMMVAFGVRELRRVPGRLLEWQRSLDEHARATGVDLLWCMALPGDLFATVELDRIVAVRTCDDYRFADDPATLWIWYLTVNRLAEALDLRVFKDCSFTAPAGNDPIDGDDHAELESLLAVLGGGVVGIGDRIGRTDPALVARMCGDDGRLALPDTPIALADASWFDAGMHRGLCWAVARLGDWSYLVAINTSLDRVVRPDRFELDEERYVYDWRARTGELRAAVECELEPRDWALFVCCPVADGRAIVGDPDRWVTMAGLVDREPPLVVEISPGS